MPRSVSSWQPPPSRPASCCRCSTTGAGTRTSAPWRACIDNGRLGELWRVHSRFDLDDPDTLEAGPGGGLLRDLGSHVVDQMIWLLGDVRSVNAHLDWIDLPEGRTDASFLIDLEHASGVRSTVESSKANHLEARELRAYGSEGSYRALGTDVQAQAIFAGRRPADDPEEWGYESPLAGDCSRPLPARCRCRPSRVATTTSTLRSPQPSAVRDVSRCRRTKESGRSPSSTRRG